MDRELEGKFLDGKTDLRYIGSVSVKDMEKYADKKTLEDIDWFEKICENKNTLMEDFRGNKRYLLSLINIIQPTGEREPIFKYIADYKKNLYRMSFVDLMKGENNLPKETIQKYLDAARNAVDEAFEKRSFSKVVQNLVLETPSREDMLRELECDKKANIEILIEKLSKEKEAIIPKDEKCTSFDESFVNVLVYKGLDRKDAKEIFEYILDNKNMSKEMSDFAFKRLGDFIKSLTDEEKKYILLK